MGEKTRLPIVSETYEVDGVFIVEHRTGLDRRRQKSRRVLYERRINTSPRRAPSYFIDEEV